MLDVSASGEETRNDSKGSKNGRGKSPASLANLRPVRKGEVRNPSGRSKKDYNLAAMAQEHAELAVETLAACLIAEDSNWPSKVSAAAEILDRGFGRAPASLDVNHTMGISEEFEAFVRQITGRPKIIEAQVEEISNVSQETPGRHLACDSE